MGNIHMVDLIISKWAIILYFHLCNRRVSSSAQISKVFRWAAHPSRVGQHRLSDFKKEWHPLARHMVGFVHEIPPGNRKITEVNGRSIGIFNVDGAFYALLNRCPHQAAHLCEGTIAGTTLPSRPGEYVIGHHGKILRCPWHGWEFDVTTGQSVFDPFKCRVRTYDVTVESEDEDEWPSVETYPVTVETGRLYVHM